MLKITDLTAETAGKTILDARSLAVNAGEVQAIMGPNGVNGSMLHAVRKRR